MKNLTASQISYVSGGLSSMDYIAVSSIHGAVGGMVLGLIGQVSVVGMYVVKQTSRYTIGSAFETTVGVIIWTLPMLVVGIGGGAVAGAAVGTACVATGLATLTES